MIELENKNPYSKSEILASLNDVSRKVSAYYNSIKPEYFFHDKLGGWSPAQNLHHIADIATGAIFLLRVPRFIFLIFGKVEAPRDFQTLLFEYIGSGKVVQLGPFAPGRIVAENERKKIGDLLERWEKVNQELLEVVKSLPEEELDTYSLPHPSMGMMSLREVLYLLIIHPIHHTYKVEQKLAPYM